MSKINILVVDDRPEGLLAVEAVLNSPQYNIVSACSGSDALKRLLEDDYAVILLDVQMPVMNGFETAAVIKTREKSKDIPIVFMSAINQDEHYVYQGYGVGAVDYILKPFDPYILKSKVKIFADLYRLNQKIKEQAQRLHENDIKIYTQALDKLELESLRKYQYLADSIPQIVFRLLPDGNHVYFNKAWYQYTGMTEGDSMELSWKEAIHPQDLTSLLSIFFEGKEGGREFECRILNAQGEARWHLVRMEPEIYSDPKIIKTWLGTATDIEERKKKEEEQRFLSEVGELLVSSLDFEENIHRLNDLAVPKFSDWFSYEPNSGGGKRAPLLEEERKVLCIPLSVNGQSLGEVRFGFSGSGRRFDESQLELGREIGERLVMARENCRLYKLSQEAIEIRNDFLSIASHELNTPITSLKLQLQVVLKSLTNSKEGNVSVDKFSGSINGAIKQVNRLIGLIQVLLDVSRIQSGKFTFSFGEVSLKDVIGEVIERHQEILNNGDCQLQMNELPTRLVLWDKMRIEQVLTNLLTNAVKYAPGPIEIKVEEATGQIKIQVTDHGPGIEDDKLSSIFNRFERASSSETVGGLGLGLFIVKQIVEGHHGSIKVESHVGEGTTFTVHLPVDAVAQVPGSSPQDGGHSLTQ